MIKHNELIINNRESCSICGNNNLSIILELPGLPLTGRFTTDGKNQEKVIIDQNLLWCPKCGHGQLQYQVNPKILYDFNNYNFKTSLSVTARLGTQNFISFLKNTFGNTKVDCVLDVGCNDLYLLEQLDGVCRVRVGIDPIWSSTKIEQKDSSIKVIGTTIEDVNLEEVLSCNPDLIVCRHTIEHIFDPFLMIEKLIKFATDDAVFVFEMPSFTSLITKMRFDQVFHEHLQYFSLSSLIALFKQFGLNLIGVTENYHDWGALTVAFQRRQGLYKAFPFSFTEKDIKNKLMLFVRQMENTILILQELSTFRVYGYGAALMLPVLAYHLKSDLSFIEAILDDDIKKDGIYYSNLPLVVRHRNHAKDFKNSTIFITAVDNVKPIMKKLLLDRPKHIVYPFNVL